MSDDRGCLHLRPDLGPLVHTETERGRSGEIDTSHWVTVRDLKYTRAVPKVE